MELYAYSVLHLPGIPALSKDCGFPPGEMVLGFREFGSLQQSGYVAGTPILEESAGPPSIAAGQDRTLRYPALVESVQFSLSTLPSQRYCRDGSWIVVCGILCEMSESVSTTWSAYNLD